VYRGLPVFSVLAIGQNLREIKGILATYLQTGGGRLKKKRFRVLCYFPRGEAISGQAKIPWGRAAWKALLFSGGGKGDYHGAGPDFGSRGPAPLVTGEGEPPRLFGDF